MHHKKIVILVVFLGLILAGCSGISATATATARPGGPEFKTPEAAISLYFEGLVQGDIQKISRACAIDEVSENFKFDVYAERMNAFLPSQSLAPTDYPLYGEINKMQLTYQIFNRVKMFTYGLLSSQKMDGGMITDINSDWITRFIKEVDPKRLSSLEVKKIGQPEKSLMNNAKYLDVLAANARNYGADEATERVALFLFEKNYYYLGFTLFRYGENWKINTQVSTIAGTDINGLPQKSSLDGFESLINR